MHRRTRHFALFATLVLLAVVAGAAHAQPTQLDIGAAPQPVMPEACAVAQEQCSANCVGLGDREQVVSCLMGCDNAAALCSRDEEPTLSSEWYVEEFGHLLATKTEACHSTTPCPTEYGSCAGWSQYSNCDDPWCGVYRFCGGSCEEYPYCFGDATRQYQERYRVCLNQQTEACVEYQRIFTFVSCGC